MALKKCKECDAEISSSAKTCPQCGKKQKSTGAIILGIILVIIGIGMLGSDTTTTTTDNTLSNTTTSTSVVTKENYDKIKEGMTKEEVKAILGEPTSVSESETPGVGTMELNHFQEPLTFIGIDIYFLNDKVYMKNYTEL